MFEHQTKEAILQRMRDASPKEIDTRQGSITYDLLSPAAIELAHAYIELDHVLKFGFAGPEQPSEYLDLRAGELGLTRRPSVKAEGKLVFSGDEDTIIPEGTAVSTDEEEAVIFITTEPGIIKQKKATVKAVAAAGGKRGNVDKGRVKLVLGNLSGIVTVTNPEEFVNGAETESDESLLVRYFDRVRRPATSGNAWHYRQWALEVRGVGDVKVFPVWNGGGTVKLCVLSEDKIAPNSTIVQDVREAVDARRPVGASVTVVPAQELKINVTANVTLASGAVLANVKALFSDKLKAFLADLAFQSPVVPYNRIFGLLLDIEAVTDFKNLTINGVANQNLNIGDEQVAVAGTVNFVV
ncbi:baseplate J/gp47 family protein [Paenibacillus sp. MBLB2552]|uniref:Baseplate J/gp47 family protein n=1 Tax=Paenibacillus mellifer TaxID=2937794 RepID=A0A9X1XYJ5_9BACL|nr:baseplate J/gp47 family protein [Paenibacillus mellifer]MCK8487126.1 baseplate J/gp47 family protein [Paenibacillus mellifer]